MKPSISVIIPALNEEHNLQRTVQDLLHVLDERFSSYEIILINDGSTDGTPQLVNQIASKNPFIRVIHHPQNKGLGFSVREGYELATKDYTVWNPGDGGMKSFDSMFHFIGKADVIIPYIANPEFRGIARRFISKAYVVLMNLLFGLNLKCYNGTVIYRTDLIKATHSSTFGYFFFAETLIVLLKSGCSYVEVPTYHQERAHGKSKAFTLKNIGEILKRAISLAWDVRVVRSKKVSLSSS